MSRPEQPPTRRLVSISAAAAYAAVCDRTIRRRISDGTLAGYRIGSKTIRVDLNEVDAMLRPIPAADGAA